MQTTALNLARELARLALIVAVAVVAMIGARASGSAAADDADGVPLSTELGTSWQIVSGYNISTHTGEDPHALDIVRVDAKTAGSAVLSPVAGQVRYVSDSCISVEDRDAPRHLLCHLWVIKGLERGDMVAEGTRLGSVAPPGYAGNNGLAHIHYALHRGFGGETVQTLPFTGKYALEGVNLINTGKFNEHAGRTF